MDNEPCYSIIPLFVLFYSLKEAMVVYTGVTDYLARPARTRRRSSINHCIDPPNRYVNVFSLLSLIRPAVK